MTGPVPTPAAATHLHPSARSWTEVIAAQAGRIPDAVALSDDHGVTLTFGELAEQVRRSAAVWLGRGVAAGDRVAILGGNSVELVVNLFGLSWIGACPLMLNWRLTPRELAQLGDACPVVAVAHDTAFHAGATALLPAGPRFTMLDGSSATDASTAAARERVDVVDVVDVPGPTPTATMALLHTSGTTGLPKIIPLGHGAHIAGCRQMAELAGLRAGDAHLRFTPLFHLAGLQELCFSLLTGGSTHLMAGFDPEVWLDTIASRRVRWGHLPPVTLRRVVDSYEARVHKPDLSSLAEVWYGTAPASLELVDRALAALGCGLRQIYGMTEAQTPVAMLMPEDHRLGAAQVGSAGRVLPWWQWRVRAGGTDVPTGTPGELVLRGPLLFGGYWTPEGTAGVGLDAAGWYASGDVVVADESGYITVVDRVKDMIVTGGENVYPAEVELVLSTHPDVAEVCVIGVPNRTWGESVHAVVVPRSEAFDAAAFEVWAGELLAGFKKPRSVEVVAEIPRNGLGKVLKRELRAGHWAGHTRGVS